MNRIARASLTERADLFTETANRLDIAESLIEKDFWVCWLLKQLFSIEAFGTEGWNLAVDRQDPNTLRFQYPKGVSQQASYVIPRVLLVLGPHAEFIPRGDFLIRSFAASEFPKPFQEPDVLVC